MKRHRLLRILFLYIPLGYIGASLLLVFLLKWMPVAFTPLMIERRVQNMRGEGEPVEYRWTPLEEISPNLIKAVVTAEDNKFFQHNGFDVDEIRKMKQEHRLNGKRIRGCSTISQQTAKNCFTWCTHSWVRKAFEAYYTVLIEKIWGKERIIEVYLNVAEMGPGIFGAKCASRKYFGKEASSLSLREAVNLACGLPNPAKRNPSVSRNYLLKIRSGVYKRIGNLVYPEWVTGSR